MLSLVESLAASPRESRVALQESAMRGGRCRCRLGTRPTGVTALRTVGRGRRGSSRLGGGGSGLAGLVAIVLAGRGRHVGGREEVRDGRAGEDVRRAGVEDTGVQDAWVGVAVSAGEGDSLVGSAGLRAPDVDLRAGRVKLGAAQGLGEVERDDLVPDEVLTRCDICWEGQIYRTAVHDVLLVPSAPIWFFTDLVNFEPLGVGTIELVAGRGVAGSHICH